jgi:hypothetical protein
MENTKKHMIIFIKHYFYKTLILESGKADNPFGELL